jgi:hypothetical protein
MQATPGRLANPIGSALLQTRLVRDVAIFRHARRPLRTTSHDIKNQPCLQCSTTAVDHRGV